MAEIEIQQGGALRGRALWLAVGDALSFFAFAWVGRRSHAEAAGLEALWATVETAAPFFLGWLLVAPWVGAFRSEPTQGIGGMAGRTALAWLLAWPIGLVLRALWLQRAIPLSFALVTGLTNLVLLVGWRSFFAWLTTRRER